MCESTCKKTLWKNPTIELYPFSRYMIGFRILFQQILQLQMFLAGEMALTDFTSLPKYSMLSKAFGTCFQKQWYWHFITDISSLFESLKILIKLLKSLLVSYFESILLKSYIWSYGSTKNPQMMFLKCSCWSGLVFTNLIWVGVPNYIKNRSS
jgi:hypothetical protein